MRRPVCPLASGRAITDTATLSAELSALRVANGAQKGGSAAVDIVQWPTKNPAQLEGMRNKAVRSHPRRFPTSTGFTESQTPDLSSGWQTKQLREPRESPHFFPTISLRPCEYCEQGPGVPFIIEFQIFSQTGLIATLFT